MRKKLHFSSVFSYFIESQTLNEKCCVYLGNLLHLSDRKVPFLGQFDKLWICQNEYNILYCGKSYSFHRYCRQKILRLIVFVVLPGRGVRFF